MKSICEIGSQLDCRTASLRWLDEIDNKAAFYLDVHPNREGRHLLKQARRHADLARRSVEAGNAEGAALAAMGALQAVWQAEIAEGRVMIDQGVTIYRAAERKRLENIKAVNDQHAKWRDQAAAIKRKNPRLSKLAIARQIDANRFETIRKVI